MRILKPLAPHVVLISHVLLELGLVLPMLDVYLREVRLSQLIIVMVMEPATTAQLDSR